MPQWLRKFISKTFDGDTSPFSREWWIIVVVSLIVAVPASLPGSDYRWVGVVLLVLLLTLLGVEMLIMKQDTVVERANALRVLFALSFVIGLSIFLLFGQVGDRYDGAFQAIGAALFLGPMIAVFTETISKAIKGGAEERERSERNARLDRIEGLLQQLIASRTALTEEPSQSVDLTEDRVKQHATK